MPEHVTVLPEPALEFRHHQALLDPHAGLTIFGPFDADRPQKPAISYAVVGTQAGCAAFGAFTSRLRMPIASPGGLDPRLWPLFPGFEAAFLTAWPSRPARTCLLQASELAEATLQADGNQRAATVVDRYVQEIAQMAWADDRIDLVVCVVPDIVFQRCRPLSRIPRSIGVGLSISSRQRSERAQGQLDMFAAYDPSTYQYSVDFRRQLKARSMEHEMPVQIVRESTLALDDEPVEGKRRLTCLADRAWNLGVGLYYKAGGKPWRLDHAREGTCYVGLAYRHKHQKTGGPTAVCAAQMFLDSGDGIVFMGEYGPWYSERHQEFHLTREAAARLMKGVLKTYAEQGGPPLREVFLHCRSGLNQVEFLGFREACPSHVKLVGIRVHRERRDVRLMREGSYPVLRGTLWEVGERLAFLWASGMSPTIGTYRGSEIPLPLRIELQHGEGTIQQVAADILALTKLNYNACRLGESEPVTVGFSDAVGEILVSNPGVRRPKPNFKYYI